MLGAIGPAPRYLGCGHILTTAVTDGKPAQLTQYVTGPLMLQRGDAWKYVVTEPTMRLARVVTPFVVAIGGCNALAALRDADGWAHYPKGMA
jgi:hypothetical protein